MFVPEDGAGLLGGAGLEELHELCGEGWSVLVPGTEDHVGQGVIPELPRHQVGGPAGGVPDGGVGPGLEEEGGGVQLAEHGGQEERGPEVGLPLSVDRGSSSQQERDELLSLTVAGKTFCKLSPADSEYFYIELEKSLSIESIYQNIPDSIEQSSLADTVHIVDGSPESDAELDDVEDGVVGVGPVGAGLVQDGDLGVGQLPPEVEPGVRHWSQKVLNIAMTLRNSSLDIQYYKPGLTIIKKVFVEISLQLVHLTVSGSLG